MVGELPQPTFVHVLDITAVLTPLVRGHGGRGAQPEVAQAVFHRVGRHRERTRVQRHERQQPGNERLRTGHVAGVREPHREVVIEIRRPCKPVRRQVESLTGPLRMGHRGAEGIVGIDELGLIPVGDPARVIEQPHLTSPDLEMCDASRWGFIRVSNGM